MTEAVQSTALKKESTISSSSRRLHYQQLESLEEDKKCYRQLLMKTLNGKNEEEIDVKPREPVNNKKEYRG